MFSKASQGLRGFPKRGKRSRGLRQRNSSRRRLGVESLEARRVLAVFLGGGAITINDDATATPYPSTNVVALPNGVTADALDVNITLTDVSHTNPDDIDILLVGPAGGAQNALIMSDAGNGDDIVNVTLTFDDEAASMLPDNAQIASGTFQPSNFDGTEDLPATAPPTAGSMLSVFDGADFEGTWNLFVDDDSAFDDGSIGSWSLDIQLGGAVIVSAGAAAGDGAPDEFNIIRNGDNVEVRVGGGLVFDEPLADVTSLTIRGSSDNDTLTVDVSGGLIPLANNIRFEGKDGFDVLNVSDTGGAPTNFTDEAINLGSLPGDGTHTLDGQTIEFFDLEPINSNALAANYIIGSQPGLASLLQDDNQINYSAGQTNGPTWGRVTVDNYEPIEFINKANLTINAGSGSDEISLNNAMTPTGLTGITVNGGDPTAGSDTAIISGTTGADTINFAPTTDDDAVVTGAGPVPITLATVEGAVIDGQGGGDALTYTSPAGVDVISLESKSIGAGASISAVQGAAPNLVLMPLSYTDIFGPAPQLAFADASGARTDVLFASGTQSEELFGVTAAGQVTVATPQSSLTLPVFSTPGVAGLTLQGLDGDDVFNVAGNHPFTGVLGPGIAIEGGNPDGGSDVLNLLGAAATVENVVITQSTTNPTNQVINGLGGAISASGVELITYTGNARDDTLVVETTAGADNIRVDDQAAGVTARVTSEQMPNIDFTNVLTFQLEAPLAPPAVASDGGAVTATFATLNLDPATAYQFIGNSEDVLVIEGADTFPDLFTVANPIAGPAGGNVVVTDTTASFGAVAVTNLTTGPFAPGEVRLNTLAGDDVVIVDTGGGGFGGVDLIDTRIVYDGGTGGDLLNVLGAPATAVVDTVYTPGPDPTSGRIDYGTAATAADLTGATLTGVMQIEFRNLQPVLDVVPATNLTVNANNQDNTITYRAGPAAAPQTGLVAVDNNETLLFANKTVLTLNGLDGDDTINLENTAAPAGLTFIVGSGGLGRDAIDASGDTTGIPLMLFGGADDDTLVGGLGGDILLGGVGNDTLVDSGGNDYFDGGNNGQIPTTIPAGIGFPAVPGTLVLPPAVTDPISATGGVDAVVVRGSGLGDVLNVIQNAPTGVAGSGYPLAVVNSAGGAVPPATADILATVVAGAVPNVAASRSSIEDVRIEAGAGNDQIAVAHADVYSGGAGTPQQMVRFDVRGNAPDASDRLVIQDLGLGDVVLIRQSANERTGRVTVAPAVNTTDLLGFNGDIVYSGIENVDVNPLNPFNGGTGTDGLGRVVVFQADPFEANDALPIATDIGDVTTIHRDPTIDPGNFAGLFGPNADEDWYVFNATQAGAAKLDLLFAAIGPLANGRAGLPGGGALVVGVYNAAGVLIAAGSGLNNAGGTPIGQTVQFATLANTSYFIRVTGAPLTAPPAASASAAINTYDLNLTANLDDLGPQIIDPDGPAFPAQAIQIVDNPFFNLFTNKPASGPAGPTPPIHGLTINFRDPITRTQTGISPGATLGALDAATALNPANYSVVGDATGPVAITGVSFAHPATTPSVLGAVLAAGPNSTSSFNIGAALNPPPAAANANSSAIVGQTIQWTSGANTGLTARIVGYNNGTGVASVATPFPAAAATGDGFIILPIPDVVSPLTLLQGVTVAPGYAAPAADGMGAFSGDVNIAVNPPAAYIGQSVQLTDNSSNAGFTATVPEQRTIVGVNAAGAFVFNQPFSGNVPAGTTFNIVGTAASAQGVVAAAPTATTFGAIATPAGNFGNGSVAGAALSAANGFYVGQALTFTNGPSAGQSRLITGYNAGGATFTFSQPFTTVPRAGDHFLIGPSTTPPVQGGAAGAATTTTTIIGTPAVVPAAGASVGGLSTTPGDYVGQLLIITSGAQTGETQLINGYNGAGVLTVENPFSAAPIGATFIITPVNQAAVTISFAGALPDDRYTLTVHDSIRDYAGNALDGENNGTFPSGDGVSGGDFVTSGFTVDSAAELAVWSGGSVYIDANGNFTFDPNHPSNPDIVHTFGFTTDHIFVGDFANAGFADGYDKLAAYGRVGNGATAAFRWLIDTTNDGIPDIVAPTTNIIGMPVAGNFNAAAGDEVGLFTGSAWIFDAVTPDFNLGDEAVVASNMSGIPFVGDFDGDGADDLGTYNSVNNTFNLSLTGSGNGPAAPNTTTTFTLSTELPFIGVRSRPVAGDIDGDGIDDIGLWVPDRSGVFPSEAAEWYILVSGGAPLTNRITAAPQVINFNPVPFGNDRFAQFGDEFGIPLLGNFDPPAPGSSSATNSSTTTSTITNTATPDDTTESETTSQPTATEPPITTNAAPVVSAGFGTLTTQQGAALPEFDLNRVFDDDGDLLFSVVGNTNSDLLIGSIVAGRLRLQALDGASGMAKLTIEARDSAGNSVQDTLELHVVAVVQPVVPVDEPVVPVVEPVVPVVEPVVPVVEPVVPVVEPVVPVVEPVVPAVELNEPPIALDTTIINALDDSDPIQVDLQSKFVDSDDSVLGYQVVSISNPSLVSGVVSGSRLTLHVSEGNAGTSIVAVRASDSAGGTATHSIVVHVTSSNRAPVASTTIRAIRVQEDAATEQLDLSTLFSDPDGDDLQYQISNTNASLVSPHLVDAALDLLFAAGTSGRASIEVTATDPEGLQARMELRIDVEEQPETIVAPAEPVIDAPVPDPIPPLEDVTNEDTPSEDDPPAEVEPAPRPRLSLRSFLAR